MLLNIRGLRQERRKLITSVVSSQILYAAPVWAKAMGVRSYARGIEADYRLCAPRTSCAFTTVSDDAALVIERGRSWPTWLRTAPHRRRPGRGKREPLACQTGNGDGRHHPRDAGRFVSFRTCGEWTGRKHGQVDFYLTPALSVHGCFRSYLQRFGHESEDCCSSCGSGVTEDPLHVLFDCKRFEEDRLTLEEILEEDLYTLYTQQHGASNAPDAGQMGSYSRICGQDDDGADSPGEGA
ncbi:hypothetical protein KR074_011682 [Drosophila pseudoananassae]|nr:hypothetical protein KR074_011682 [Drosophila pseudoananassae]